MGVAIPLRKAGISSGNLPYHLGALCREVWTPVLDLRPEDRGKELLQSRLEKQAFQEKSSN